MSAFGVHGDEGMQGMRVGEETMLCSEGMSGLSERQMIKISTGEKKKGEGVRVGRKRGTEEEEEVAKGEERRRPRGVGGGESADEEVVRKSRRRSKCKKGMSVGKRRRGEREGEEIGEDPNPNPDVIRGIRDDD